MKIAIVNQFAPPDEVPTSVLAGELADDLRSRGHEVELLSCDGGYRSGRSFRGSRLVYELRAHLRLFWKSMRCRRVDVLLALSSPACLPATVAFAARLKGCRFAHWAMDVYPDVAVALGEIPRNGVVHQLTSRAMRWAYRRAEPLVSLTEKMAECLPEPSKICPPWPPQKLTWPDIAPSSTATFIWLYSGNLGRAHLFRPLLLAQQILERRGIPATLVFQGGGHSLPAAKSFAAELGLKNCLFRDYAPKEELLNSLMHACVLVATQAPQTDGLLWPSKLAVMSHVPRPILWIGISPPSVDAEVFPPEDSTGIADWLEQQIASTKQVDYSPPTRPIEALDNWNQWLTQA